MASAVLWLALLVDLAGILYCIYFIRSILLLFKRAPFVRTRAAVAEEIAQYVGALPAGSVVYDLGCGDGRVLRAIHKRNPEAQLVGIELQLFPYLLARLRCSGVARIIRGDIFAQDLSAATHLYAYLYYDVLDRLLPKLERELQPGTRLYSLDFAFSHRTPFETITLRSRAPGKLGSILYVYEF